MKDQLQLIALFNRYLANQCSLEEVEELMRYFNSGDSHLLEERIMAEFQKLDLQDFEQDALPERIFLGIKSRIAAKQQLPIARRLWPRWAAAAAAVIAVATGTYFYHGLQVQQSQPALVSKADVAPGKDGATLTLGNGKKISIADALAGRIASDAGVTISKTVDGELIYELQATKNEILTSNTLTTTRGEQIRVRLPDGTLVFLNAASSLSYPTVFTKERKVELKGEAYFEVAHNRQKPFKVLSGNQQVSVLGTHFNINSYTDEKEITTTLVEGSVAVSSLKENRSQIIKPNQQAIFSKTGAISVTQANVEDVVAWKNGKFVFDQEDIASVMRKLSRWYNVEVEYRGNLQGKTFTGSISRFDNISKILDKIAFTDAVHIKLEGRRVIIMP